MLRDYPVQKVTWVSLDLRDHVVRKETGAKWECRVSLVLMAYLAFKAPLDLGVYLVLMAAMELM